MLHRHKNRVNKIMAPWYVSYITIIVVVMSSTFVIINYFSNQLESKIRSYSQYVFETLSQNACNKMIDVSNFLIETEDKFHMLDSAEFNTIDDYYLNEDVLALVEHFKKINTGKKLVPIVYIKKSDVVLSEMGVLRSKDYYRARIDESAYEYEQWLNKLIGSEPDVKSYYSIVYKTHAPKKDVLLWRTNYKNNIFVAVGCFKEDFFELYDNDEIIKNYGMAIYSQYGYKVIECDTNLDFEFSNKITEVNNKNNNYYFYRNQVLIDDFRWTAVAVANKDVIKQEVYSSWVQSMIIIFMALIIILLIIYCVLRWNYRAIKLIKGVLNLEKADGYAEIHSKILSILELNTEIKSVNTKNDNIILELLLKSVFSEGSLADFDKKMIEEKSKYPNFCVLYFYIKDIDEFFVDEKDLQKKYFYLKLVINNIFEESYNAKDVFVKVVEDKERFICLLNLPHTEESIYNNVVDIAANGTNTINKEFNISLIYTVSKVYSGTEHIIDAYKEAEQRMNERLFFDFGEAEQKSYGEDISLSDYVPSDELSKLFNCMVKGDFKGSVDNINSILDNVAKPHCLYTGFTVNAIIAGLLKGAEICKVKNDNIAGKTIKILNNINNTKNYERVREDLIELTELICSHISRKHEEEKNINRDNRRIVDIVNYIEMNYTDSNINISTIAYEFNLTPYYISKIFKENTDMNMLEYINKLRIDKAEELLKDESYTVEEIAEMVGFTHKSSFYRTYKKIKGTHPGRKRNSDN